MPPLVRYFVSVAGTEDHSGPFTLAQLQGSWRRGDIDPQSLVWKEGTEAWLPVQELKETLDPPTFEDYLASPRSGGPDKVRRQRQKQRQRRKSDSPATMPSRKRRGAAKGSSKAQHSKGQGKSTAKQVAIIVMILILAMAGVAGMMMMIGKLL